MLSRLFHFYRRVLVPGIITTALLGLLSGFALASLDQTGQLWAPYVGWSFENPTYSGNPFDLVASATFTHTSSGETRKTELFYDGGTTWKLRFAGTRIGEWTFTTTSADPELNGISGIVTINPNPGVYGFVTNVGNKWARQTDDSGSTETFIPNFVIGIAADLTAWDSSYLDSQITTFFDMHGFNGMFTFLGGRWCNINSSDWDDCLGNYDPDFDTFAALELLITKVHTAGGVVHIWAYGDCARDQCPDYGFGTAGAVTVEEQRILRYIAARLGPLPGWIMGYGFDVPEYGSTAEIDAWGDYLHSKLGWYHYLGARNQSKSNYTLWPDADWWSWGELNWTYSQVTAAMDSNTNKPHSLDERFWLGRWDETQQRRGLWHFAMAGGASAIWAYDATGGIYSSYPHPEQFKTYSRFWNHRFLANMVRANNLTDGYCLKSSDNKNFVFYKENTASIQMDLSVMAGPQAAIAVDTKAVYGELNLGSLSATNQTWTAPYASDWAIAVGDFASYQITPPPAPTNLKIINVQ